MVIHQHNIKHEEANLRVAISNMVDDPEWDSYVANHPSGSYVQMALWGRVKKVQGWKPIRIILRNDQGQIIGGAQILWKTILSCFNYGYISDGPLVDHLSKSSVKILIDLILKTCINRKLHYLACQPMRDKPEMVDQLVDAGFWLSEQGNIEKPARVKIKIYPDDDLTLEHIKPKKRKLIRKAQKSPFIIREGNKTDLCTFYQLHKATGMRARFDIQSLDFFTELWDVFYPKKLLSVHVCEYDGEPVSSSINIHYIDTVESYRFGWSGKYCHLLPHEALDWHIIQWAGGKGYQWYDFGGIDRKVAETTLATGKIPEDSIHSYYAYKLHYSHNIEFYPDTYEYIFRPVFRIPYKAIMCSTLLSELAKSIYKKWLNKR